MLPTNSESTTSNNSFRHPSFCKKPLCAALVLASVTGLYSGNALSQDEAIEEVVVTGTRKAGLEPTQTLSPVDVFSGAALENQASFDLTDSLTKLTPSLNTQRFPIADGTAFVRPVTLRNLAPDQTLVLVNGTRRHRSALVNLQLAPLGTVNQGSQAVDFSAFPASAIKRVEVLRDGASAQYGSDAIAGVINVILNDDDEGFSVDTQYGQYFEGDGERISVNANAGFGLGENGFVNVSYEHSQSDITSRGNPRPDAAAIAAIVGADNVAYNGYGQRWGDPDIEADKVFVNFGYDLTESTTLYANASYMDNSTLSGFFYRGPVIDDPAAMVTARGTLQVDANGDFIPDDAPQALIDSITGQGLNPADYLVASATSPSGYVLRNPIWTQFPGGYSPLFGADIEDKAFVIGLKGDLNDSMTYDVRARTAENEISYVLEDTINPSLGALSPTKFNPGNLAQEESSFNADFVKTFEDSPLNVAFGAEWREEIYKIGEGDAASTAVGPTFVQFGVGSDGFQGFDPASAGEFKSESYAAYVDMETDITDNLSGAIALRYEDFDLYGSTLDWKVSARLAATDTFAIRATVNTGFRAPTPGQVNTLNVTTTADSSGNLIPSGTYPVDHPVALALGSQPLETEESLSYTLGVVWDITESTSLTVDYYNISVEDRIGLQNTTVDQATVDALTASGYPNAGILLNSSASYFANGFDSDITGVDLNLSSAFEMGVGELRASLGMNFNDQEVKNIQSGIINDSRIFDLENQVPSNRGVLTVDFTTESYTTMLRLNHYGSWKSTGGLFSPGDASDVSSYGSALLVDLEFTFNVNENFKLSFGGENIFDEMPDDEGDGTLRFLGVTGSVTSPFGFNGGFWYGRASFDF